MASPSLQEKVQAKPCGKNEETYGCCNVMRTMEGTMQCENG